MPRTTDPELREFIRRLPKTETHLHIEGGLPLNLLREVRPDEPEPESWAHDFKYRDFAHFEQQLLTWGFAFYTSPEQYYRSARQQFEQHLALGVRYVECSFASGVSEFGGINAKEIFQAIKEAAPAGLEVRVFMGIHHSGCGEKMRHVIEDSLTWDGFAGVDLHGPEDLPIEPWTAEIWAAARAVGKYTKAHAGEFLGADFVRRILEETGAQRIQHGIRSVEDPALVRLLAISGITLDVCPISNAKLVPGVTLENHPIRELVDAGVKVTVNTDDPISFGNNLIDDYEALFHARGFTRAELKQLARNGLEVALVDESTRASWLAELDAISV
ncbi:adenosine deaminase family protein [Cerasicoccus arenae]|uniref:Adenosine deaminase n=2 Tax=Cerasicoccus arenae TaxID=424488 RepID=A0A8J3GBW8_9BACT|nr:adenosine deaminase family protein [Cerasicoccus arenae]MBK1856988.1 adenosine deaminase family protein [Cerasicoccus arenae]GHB90256.1 adenosine deaminase [Cerasicoccus arenae]